MVISLPCFPTFWCSAIPTSCYIFNVFHYLFMSFFQHQGHAWAEVCHHTAAEVCHRQLLIYGQLTQALATLGSIGWRITDPSILSNTESTLLWMDDKASSPCIKTRGTHRSRHSKSMDNTSLNHSDIFILMIGTYLSLRQVPGSIDNTVHLRSHAQARYTTTHTDLISNSAIMSNNFVSLLSDI